MKTKYLYLIFCGLIITFWTSWCNNLENINVKNTEKLNIDKTNTANININKIIAENEKDINHISEWFAWSSIKDISYWKNSSRQKLDIHYPEKKLDNYPVVVWIHGGGFRQWDKSQWEEVFKALTAEWFVVISMNYRFLDEAKFPAQIHDAKGVIRWIKANSNKYNLDSKNINVMWVSAGWNLAILLWTTKDIKRFEWNIGGNLKYSSSINSVVDLFWASESAINYVSQWDSPFLIIHGNNDRIVPISESINLDRKLKDKGVKSELIIVEWKWHNNIPLELYKDKIIYFLRENIK